MPTKWIPCRDCLGYGKRMLRPGVYSKTEHCPVCKGSGEIERKQG